MAKKTTLMAVKHGHQLSLRLGQPCRSSVPERRRRRLYLCSRLFTILAFFDLFLGVQFRNEPLHSGLVETLRGCPELSIDLT